MLLVDAGEAPEVVELPEVLLLFEFVPLDGVGVFLFGGLVVPVFFGLVPLDADAPILILLLPFRAAVDALTAKMMIEDDAVLEPFKLADCIAFS